MSLDAGCSMAASNCFPMEFVLSSTARGTSFPEPCSCRVEPRSQRVLRREKASQACAEINGRDRPDESQQEVITLAGSAHSRKSATPGLKDETSNRKEEIFAWAPQALSPGDLAGGFPKQVVIVCTMLRVVTAIFASFFASLWIRNDVPGIEKIPCTLVREGPVL